MYNQLPYIISTTEIQRNPSILSNIEKDRYIIVTKGSKKVGVFLPMKMFGKTRYVVESEKSNLAESNPFGYSKSNSFEKQIMELAGSVKVPEKFKNTPIEDIIATAKKNYFKAK